MTQKQRHPAFCVPFSPHRRHYSTHSRLLHVRTYSTVALDPRSPPISTPPAMLLGKIFSHVSYARYCTYSTYRAVPRNVRCVHLLDRERKISESLFLWFWKMRMEKFYSRDKLFYHIWYMWSKTLFSVFVSRKQKPFFFFILAIFARIFSFCGPIFCLSDRIFCLCESFSHFLFMWSHFPFMLIIFTFSVYVKKSNVLFMWINFKFSVYGITFTPTSSH